ncbi:cupin domain-containing protein [Campylobacter sp. MIT 19-121]|uniref:cupin domain-containing protein n=1 Tax=Campylobacter sp. MIT 19-121 TaxID=2703906 RepID=UPI001389F3F1|nr:cupin domain-containing protein [Campylobacter sp. MIT 19-121]NDJ27879.1 cupin domain-containing protein [Campylobacter sp. MIT 19-121]
MQVISWDRLEFKDEQVGIKVLHENANAKEIQIIMPKESMMKEHKAPFDISVQVLKGEIEFSLENEIFKLKALDMIALSANVPHSLKALKDSIVRLSLAKADSIARVNAILKPL